MFFSLTYSLVLLPRLVVRMHNRDVMLGYLRLKLNLKCMFISPSFSPSFAASGSDLEPFLEGIALNEAFEQKKLYIVNHKIMDGLTDIQNNNKVGFQSFSTLRPTIFTSLTFLNFC